MPRQLRVHFLPDLADPHDLAGHTHVVIDVLRASTTIAHAIAAGAEGIVPCLEVAEAREMASKIDSDRLVLGGERKGLPISGFDLGNSPSEYQTDRVNGKTVCFTTTNGTRAMMRCIGAERVFIGSFVNLSMISRAIQEHDQIELVCAGTHGQITREDVLLAGAVVARQLDADRAIQLSDPARLALDAWRAVGGDAISDEQLSRELSDSQGGRNLASIGMESDIALAARIDAVSVLPELDLSNWRITRSPG